MPDPVVLIPGLQANRASWAHQIAHLSPRRAVLVPDGYHGLTSITAMADHTLSQCPERFHLVAWSMGGYIALEMLTGALDRVQSLILIATSARPETEDSRQRRAARLDRAVQIGLRADHGETIEGCVHDPAVLSDTVSAAMADASVALGLNALRSQQAAIVDREDKRPVLPFLTCPTLVVTGEGDPVIDPACSTEMQSLIPGAQLVTIPECGHCPPLEHPGRINQLLDDWIGRHDRRLPGFADGEHAQC